MLYPLPVVNVVLNSSAPAGKASVALPLYPLLAYRLYEGALPSASMRSMPIELAVLLTVLPCHLFLSQLIFVTIMPSPGRYVSQPLFARFSIK